MLTPGKFLLICLIAVFSLFLPSGGNAQIPLLDSISGSLHTKPKFYLDLGSYNSNVNDQPAIFTEIAVGVVYDKRIYLCTGLNILNTEVISPQNLNEDTSLRVNGRLRMFMSLTTAEFVFYKGDPWIVSFIPLKVGIGRAYYEYYSATDKTLTEINGHTIITNNPQFYASYNLGKLADWKALKWFGISGSLGYRFTLLSSRQLNEDLESFTYSIGIKFYLDHIYDDIFPHGMFGKKKD